MLRGNESTYILSNKFIHEIEKRVNTLELINNEHPDERVNKVLERGGKIFDNTDIFHSGDEILKASKESLPKYSKFRFHQWHTPEQSTWLLNNVCLNKKGEFLFFTHPRLHSNWLKELDGKPLGFTQTVVTSQRGAFTLRMINSEIPYDKVKHWITKNVVPMKRYAVGNVGHIFSDNLIPVIEIMQQFGLDPDETVLMFLDEVFYREEYCKEKTSEGKCWDFVSSYEYDKKKAVEWSLKWSQMLSRFPLLQLCSYEVYNHTTFSTEKKLVHRLERAPCPLDDQIRPLRSKILEFDQLETYGSVVEEIDVCFKQIAVGVGGRSFISSGSHQRDSIISSFRKQIFKNMKISPKNEIIGSNKKLNNIIVGLHDKPLAGRHGNVIGNLAEIVDYLRIHLPQQEFARELSAKGINIEILPVKLEKLTSLEQIKLFSQLDVYISTVGSGSFYSLFMPEDSALLYSPQCNYVSRREIRRLRLAKGYLCSQPIIHYHSNMPHLNVFDLTPIVDDCAVRAGEEHNFLHPSTNDRCDPIINPQSLLKEVIKALEMRILKR
ncbi:hypothetical protein ABK040_003970 [Willaertia magna]